MLSDAFGRSQLHVTVRLESEASTGASASRSASRISSPPSRFFAFSPCLPPSNGPEAGSES